MPHHAIDITLTRPATPTEIKIATRAARLPLAADAHRTRLLALVPAKTPRRALRNLRTALAALLPIDVLRTAYPDAAGRRLINVELPPQAYDQVRRDAASHRQRPEEYLADAVQQALARDQQTAHQQLDAALAHFLAASTPARLLAAVAERLA